MFDLKFSVEFFKIKSFKKMKEKYQKLQKITQIEYENLRNSKMIKNFLHRIQLSLNSKWITTIQFNWVWVQKLSNYSLSSTKIIKFNKTQEKLKKCCENSNFIQFLATTVENLLLFDMGLCHSFPFIIIAALTGFPNKHNLNETLKLTPIEATWIGSFYTDLFKFFFHNKMM